MIPLSDDAKSVLTGGFKYFIRVESWLDGELLADDVPVSAGQEDTDLSLAVPERISLTIPRISDGFDWTPSTDRHPLAANGQRLRVLLGIGIGNGRVEWIQRGEFLVYESDADGDEVSVTALGLLYLVQEARLVSPFQPSGTLISTLRGLIEPALTVVVDAGLTDRSVPTGVNYDEDRLGAVNELLDAWPAMALTSPNGYLNVVPVTDPATADLTITSSGSTATVIETTGRSNRDGAASVVVTRGTASDGAPVQGAAYDQSGGPHAISGPFNPLPVPFYFFSPLLTTVAQCNASARTILARRQRETARLFEVTCVPRPDLLAGDAVSVDGVLTTVQRIQLPLRASGGAMRLTLREV